MTFNYKEWKFNEYCLLLPELTDDEFSALLKDMRINGQAFPVYAMDKEIIDGRHRFLACKTLGIDPWIIQVGDIKDNHYRGDIYDRVISTNLMRRSMNTPTKILYAIKVYEHMKPGILTAKHDAEEVANIITDITRLAKSTRRAVNRMITIVSRANKNDEFALKALKDIESRKIKTVATAYTKTIRRDHNYKPKPKIITCPKCGHKF